jgi:Uma2 family endonuclease
MSFDAFMASHEDRFAEWVDGEVIEFMPAKKHNQLLVGFLYQLLSLFARLGPGGQVMTAPYSMRAKPGGNVREPDVFYVGPEQVAQMAELLLEGPADLVVEVVSDESVRRDRDDKYHEYADAGVREYWVIDPRNKRQRADFYRLTPEGRYELFATEDDERVESSALPGFWLRPAWLWEAEERDPLMTLMEIRGLPAEIAEQIRATLRGE